MAQYEMNAKVNTNHFSQAREIERRAPKPEISMQKVLHSPQEMLQNLLVTLSGEIETLRQLSDNLKVEAVSDKPTKGSEIVSRRLERATKNLINISKEFRESRKDSSSSLNGLSEQELARQLLDGPMLTNILKGLEGLGFVIVPPAGFVPKKADLGPEVPSTAPSQAELMQETNLPFGGRQKATQTRHKVCTTQESDHSEKEGGGEFTHIPMAQVLQDGTERSEGLNSPPNFNSEITSPGPFPQKNKDGGNNDAMRCAPLDPNEYRPMIKAEVSNPFRKTRGAWYEGTQAVKEIPTTPRPSHWRNPQGPK